MKNPLPKGFVSVLQTPFTAKAEIDYVSLERLIEDAISADVDGFLAPAVASEVGYLTPKERLDLLQKIVEFVNGRIPLIAGASAFDEKECLKYAKQAEEIGAAAYLVAVPDILYDSAQKIVPFFQSIASACHLPLLIQDLCWNRYGLPLSIMKELCESIPTLAGFKIETVPAGSKFTQARDELGDEMYLCGGWSIPQLIESLDREIDAMIPESSMIRVYRAIFQCHQNGEREKALELFHRLLPVLSFTNQEITISIAFFKRLLVRKGIFQSECIRCEDFEWDRYNQRIADDLINHYLQLEKDVLGE